MSEVLNLRSLQKRFNFNTRRDTYIDGNGNASVMKWIPPFRASRALTLLCAAATPSGTIGDWFHPLDIPAGAVLNTDYDITAMGGWWGDLYLCSAPDASRSSVGTAYSGASTVYISQPGVAPMVGQTIAHFKTALAARFSTGGFSGQTGTTGWAGKGGLMTDAHWFELWIWSRINRYYLHGNTAGYTVADHIPVWHGDSTEIGVLDGAQSAAYGASITGGGHESWSTILDDFCGNRWEFTDGLRLYNNTVYSAGKTINPPANYADAAYTNTGLTITGVTSGQSVASYRTEAALKLHGIPASTTTAGAGGFDGQGFWLTTTGEIIALRGGYSSNGAQAVGALHVSDAASSANWAIGARAVLVP